MAAKQPVEYRGALYPPEATQIDCVKDCIRKGGLWTWGGKQVGAPLFDLYRELQTLIWGERCEHHDWSDLLLKTILENRITVIQGPKDTGKTHFMARFALTDYFCFPKETLILMSSTDLRGLELRVWGEIKDLYNLAKEKWPDAPGYPVDSLHGIFTDEIVDTGEARDIRRGLICIPVLDSEGQWKGLSKFAGIKQKRRRVLGDEVQFYAAPYLTTLANLDKGDFKGVFAGNPIGEGEPLDKLAEPMEGWDGLAEVSTTTTWKNRMGGITVNLVGPDSPAIRNPGKFTYLINQSDIDRIVTYWGKDSAEYWNQAMGVRRPGISARRVVTRDMARQFGAQENVVWGNEGAITNLYALDASYGGDRCVGCVLRFGKDVNRHLVISFGVPVLVPIKLYAKSVPEDDRVLAEDQIALFVKEDCERNNIPPENVFFDATGRGSLGTSFARIWSASVNPIEFGGSPSPRPVCSDMYIFDDDTRQRRLKRADEHYSKRVTELWFSVRYAMEGRQIRDLPNDVLDELCAREWTRTRGNKIEIESKEDMKPRFGRSPDLADCAAIGVEGARRLGFQISRLEVNQVIRGGDDWRDQLKLRAKRLKATYSLTYS